MHKYLLNIYLFLFFVSTFLLIRTPLKLYDTKTWFHKTMLIYISAFLILYSMFHQNKLINIYLLPLLLFLNIGILLFANKKNYLGYLNIILLLYVLYKFNYRDFKIKEGKLLSPNYQWILLHIVILIFYYITSDSYQGVTFKFSNIVLILYPLLFPMDEYFIHRVFSLLFAAGIKQYLM